MTSEEKIEQLSEMEEDVLLVDGFDDALIGYSEQGTVVAVYEWEKCVQILIERDGVSEEEALELMSYNVTGSYLGEQTPIFLRRFY